MIQFTTLTSLSYNLQYNQNNRLIFSSTMEFTYMDKSCSI